MTASSSPVDRLFASPGYLDVDTEEILECHDRVASPVGERILPDGGIHLVFNLGDRQRGERGAELDCLAMGASCRPHDIQMTGRIEQVCVRLRVGTAAAVLGVPAGELRDLGVPLDTLWGAAAHEALERLHASRDRRATMAAILRERARPEPAPAPALGEAVRRIAARAGRVRVAELAAELGLGVRRLQQLFDRELGLSPKETCRLARFRALLAGRVRSWSDAAVDAGFYDQAHLVHELKAFTGLTPGQLAHHFAFFQDGARAPG